MSNEDNNTEPTVAEQARALIDADKKSRAAEAARRIDEMCKELRVVLEPVLIIRGTEVTHGVDVRALD